MRTGKKNHVKGVLHFSQDCYTLGKQQPEMVFLNRGFFKLKEFHTGTGCDTNIMSLKRLVGTALKVDLFP